MAFLLTALTKALVPLANLTTAATAGEKLRTGLGLDDRPTEVVLEGVQQLHSEP